MPMDEDSDVAQLVRSIIATREANTRLEEHKAELRKIIGIKLIEITGYLATLGADLILAATDHPEAFPPNHSTSVDSGDYNGVRFKFGDFHATFAEFSDTAMIGVHDGDPRRTSDMIAPDRVTEGWVRDTILKRLRSFYKADLLVGPV